MDTGDGQPDIEEPAEVVSAHESIAALMTEQKKLRKQKVPGARGLGKGGWETQQEGAGGGLWEE